MEMGGPGCPTRRYWGISRGKEERIGGGFGVRVAWTTGAWTAGRGAGAAECSTAAANPRRAEAADSGAAYRCADSGCSEAADAAAGAGDAGPGHDTEFEWEHELYVAGRRGAEQAARDGGAE